LIYLDSRTAIVSGVEPRLNMFFLLVVAWTRDRPNFHGGGGAAFVGAGTSTAAAYEEEADQGHQDAEFDIVFDRIMKGDSL